jgi:hypothetical protein
MRPRRISKAKHRNSSAGKEYTASQCPTRKKRAKKWRDKPVDPNEARHLDNGQRNFAEALKDF